MEEMKPSTAKWIVKDLLTRWRYFADEDPAIPSLWRKGTSRVFLVLGDNAAGKSFFRRCVQVCCKEHTSISEVIPISMQGRAGMNMLGAVKGLVYGDEDSRSTGENSANTVNTAIRTCQGRTHSHLMYWDEPDIGMSENAAAGAGRVIAEFAEQMSKHTRGIFITSHSRALIGALRHINPHYIHLGTPPAEAPQTLEEWLHRPVTPVTPEEVKKASLNRFRAIQKVMNDVKEEKKKRDADQT